MAKSPEMEAFLEQFTQATFGRSRQGNVCVACGSDKMAEKDYDSRLDYKESTISKMCQKCIDIAFGSPADGSLDETDRHLENKSENFDGSTFATVDEEMDFWYRINQ